MTVLLLEHFPGCSPIHPCGSCTLVAHLRKKLKQEELDQLLVEIIKLSGVKPTRPTPFTSKVSIKHLKGGLRKIGYVLDATNKSVSKAPIKKPPG